VSLYEATFKGRREDVSYFRNLVRQNRGLILEFGAGAGRITLPLAADGRQVVAVDKSKAMLDRLKERVAASPESVRQGISIHRGDMRTFSSDQPFAVVLATFNVVAHLKTHQDLARFLKNARSLLKKGGLLAFDVPIPHPDEVEADPDELVRAPRFKHPDLGHWMRQTERFQYDPGTQQLLVESTYTAEGHLGSVTVPLILRQWFPKELEAILRYEGFRRVQTHADYTTQPGLLARDSLVFLARV
jgi:SAM-dependent methyltransferase